jgi:trehalose synthase
MIRSVTIDGPLTLDDYEAVGHLAPAVRELRHEARALVPALRGRKVWMLSSTAQGGGVAEMLPRMVATLRELGADTEWIVLEPGRPEFFQLTKRLHNLIHGAGDPDLGAAERELYDEVSQAGAAALQPRLGPGDLLVVHDPQPLGIGAILRRATSVRAVWRCHIGLDERTEATRSVWRFLRPHASVYDHAVFSAPEYIPSYLGGHASVIHPALDPLGPKNRELHLHQLTSVLRNAELVRAPVPGLMPAFEAPAERLLPDGSWAPACKMDDLELLFRPVVVQISRWDRLKGFEPLLEAFVRLKSRRHTDALRQRRLELVRLVLAGPDPVSVADDPEATEVLDALVERYRALSPSLQADVALLSLPMRSLEQNALMVNALQRCASVVVQNSLREGFGLTATEAMWKRIAVLGTQACGLRQQIRPGLHGLLVHDATDAAEIADALDELLGDPEMRDRFGREAQRRVHDEFLIFNQLRRWLETLADLPTR